MPSFPTIELISGLIGRLSSFSAVIGPLSALSAVIGPLSALCCDWLSIFLIFFSSFYFCFGCKFHNFFLNFFISVVSVSNTGNPYVISFTDA